LVFIPNNSQEFFPAHKTGDDVAPSSTIPVCRAEVRRIARSLTRHAADIKFVFDLDAQQSV